MKTTTKAPIFGTLSLIIFILLASWLSLAPNQLTHFDNTIMPAFREYYPFGKHFLKYFDHIGNGHLYNMIVWTTALMLAIGFKRYAEALWLYSSSMIMSLNVVPVLKDYFQRPRPQLYHHGFSFPSGHATSSMIFYGILIIILANLITNRQIR